MKTTTFILFCIITVLMIVWIAIHPERVHAGHLLAGAVFCIMAIACYPLCAKRKLPKLRAQKTLLWQVDFWNISSTKYVPLKFYTLNEAQEYFDLINKEFTGQGGITRIFPMTKDRLNNPINVITKKPMKLSDQVRYIRRKMDGRERTFRPNAENCTSFLPKIEPKRSALCTYVDARNL